MANATGRPTEPLVLSKEERDYLELQVHRRRAAARSMAERCQIILYCADGMTSKAVAAKLGIHENTVGKWRRRFLKNRTDGLLDQERPGRPRTIDDEQIAAIIERTLQSTPDATHWSIRSMAAATGFSHTTIRRIWAAFGLQPHRMQTFKLSTDPFFIDKVIDILGLYMSPPNRALVLGVNERGLLQKLDDERSVGSSNRSGSEGQAHPAPWQGTVSLVGALDIVCGFVIDRYHKQHGAGEFLEFLKQIDASARPEIDIHIILDNSEVHKNSLVQSWLMHRPRYHLHFTPTPVFWLRQVESWFGEMSRRRSPPGAQTSASQLEADMRAFIERHSESISPYKWLNSDTAQPSRHTFRQKSATDVKARSLNISERLNKSV
ncbi:transposase [Rhizobium sp. BK312]|uniref:IS630 family transposase n=1 Tax=Rhizobium sp. BK312 TaxID=2587080 RepID=UPI000DD80A81|nr:IS630 family transposase [Rhizobium sp. BK312]MBB3425784.1 transposase [Rhizobium sp. BK312]